MDAVWLCLFSYTDFACSESRWVWSSLDDHGSTVIFRWSGNADGIIYVPPFAEGGERILSLFLDYSTYCWAWILVVLFHDRGDNRGFGWVATWLLRATKHSEAWENYIYMRETSTRHAWACHNAFASLTNWIIVLQAKGVESYWPCLVLRAWLIYIEPVSRRFSFLYLAQGFIRIKSTHSGPVP